VKKHVSYNVLSVALFLQRNITVVIKRSAFVSLPHRTFVFSPQHLIICTVFSVFTTLHHHALRWGALASHARQSILFNFVGGHLHVFGVYLAVSVHVKRILALSGAEAEGTTEKQ
jgi:hypothetical protein